MNIKDALKKELINHLEDAGIESDLAKDVANPNEDAGYSALPDNLKKKLQQFSDDEVKKFDAIEQVIDRYQKSNTQDVKDDLYEIIDLWSMQWVPFWYNKFADSSHMQMDEFISEYQIIVLEAVNKFAMDWSQPNKKGKIRKAHMNGLLYMMLGQRFINNINKQYRAKRKPPIQCPACDGWVTLINNKHCQEVHGYSLYEFIEIYPEYPLSSGIGSLDEPVGDDCGASIGDYIVRNDDNTCTYEILDSIHAFLSEEEYNKVCNLFIDGHNINHKEIIDILIKNTNISNAIQNVTA
jgi:hypothetical protein